MTEEEYLAHHGILGMKWGVRKEEYSSSTTPGSIRSSSKKSYFQKLGSGFVSNIRKDGLMFAVGLESGRIQVMDVKNMLSLRVFTNHFKRINALEYANVN